MGVVDRLFAPGLLARLSGGSPRRAALVIVGAFLAPVPIAILIWFVGLASVFDDVRWIPSTVAVVFGLTAYLGLMMRFGFWGVGIHSGRDGGDQYEEFSPGTAFALGWLRWAMQVVGIGATTLVVVGVMANVRWFHLFSHPAIDAIPDRMDAMPIPDDWELSSSEKGDDGGNFRPNGYVDRRYDVPETFGFDELEAWMISPAWTDGPDAFGELDALRCLPDNEDCRASVVPADGGEPEYFVYAEVDTRSSEVQVRLTYEQYAAPDWDVSDATVARARQIPVPDDWTLYEERDSTNVNGEDFTRRFLVPDTFGPDDLEAWITSPVFTEGDDPFGAVREYGECRELEGQDTFLCSVLVVDIERTGPDDTGPVESFRAALNDDGEVRLTFSRNG